MSHNKPSHFIRPSPTNIISSSSPARPISTSPAASHRQSQSPFRYVQFDNDTRSEAYLNEKEPVPLSDIGSSRVASSKPREPFTRQLTDTQQLGSSRSQHTVAPSQSRQPSHVQRAPSPLLIPSYPQSHSHPYSRPRGLRIFNLLKPWIPLLLYAFTSLAFVFAIALYRTEVFEQLDELSLWLQRDEQFGHAVLFFLIFLTTIPPIPLYSTLITLSGYTFGAYTGAIISYFAALTGALAVFIISRSLFRDTIARWLASTTTIKRVVRAIEKRPKLLFLIRLAPYPYNVMNCLLAASPTLTLRTYTICTALSLFKVIIHTSLGASIHSFRDYHVVPDQGNNEDDTTPLDEGDTGRYSQMWTIIGIVLCVAIFIYLSIVARKAVDEELDDDLEPPRDREETIGFLSAESLASVQDLEGGIGHNGVPMTESPFRGHVNLVPYRQPPN